MREPSRPWSSSQSATAPGSRAAPRTSKPSSASGSAAVSVENSRSRRTRNSSWSNSWCTASRSHWRTSRSCGPAPMPSTSRTSSVSWRLSTTDDEVLAQRVAGLAAHLVHAVDQLVEGPELADPLLRRLLPHPRDAREVVARVAPQRREVGVLLGRERVALHDLLGRVAHEVGHALARVEHRDVGADQLERVAVARTDRHAHARGHGLRGERRDDVVGLVALDREHRDREHPQDVLDEVDLAAELVGRRGPVGLVGRERLGPEGLPRDVERHRDVRRLLVAQQVDEHGREAVDGVRRLARRGAEVLRRQGEERPVGQRVPVEQQQTSAPARRGVRDGVGLGRSACRSHAASLGATPDTPRTPGEPDATGRPTLRG